MIVLYLWMSACTWLFSSIQWHFCVSTTLVTVLYHVVLIQSLKDLECPGSMVIVILFKHVTGGLSSLHGLILACQVYNAR